MCTTQQWSLSYQFINMGFLSSPAFYFTFVLLVGAIIAESEGDDNKKIIKKHHYHSEKLTNFKLYWHDVITGDNPTAVSITPVSLTAGSTTGFGSTFVIDDALTLTPDPLSPVLGRAQGFYASASKKEISLTMAMNFVFLAGKYNGSSISILGRNEAASPVREMPVVGGSGIFRWARGYVEARTFSFDPISNDAVVEYDIHILHY